MLVHRIRYCLVLNRQDELIGIIAARSLQHATGLNLETIRASEVMLPNMLTIKPSESIHQATQKMFRNCVQHLVVVSERNDSCAALGIIGVTDILRYMLPQKKGA